MDSVRTRLRDFFTRGLWGVDLAAVGRFQSFVIRLLRLVTISFRDFSEGLISLRAMGLVYTSLLSLVPFLAVSFSVLKAFGIHNQMEPMLLNFLAPLGPRGPEISGKIIGFVENMNVGVLGSIGLAMLLYTVISLIQKIEGTFNEIWRVRKHRGLARRFSDYMSVILIGPVLVFSGLGLTAALRSTAVVQKILAIEVLGSAVFFAGKLVPFFMACAAFSFIYVFVPSTKVHLRSALVGGLFAGLLWQTAGIGFASFIVSSTKYHAIYSGFAILIFFMIWLYLSWLILFFGAKVAFYHQYPHSLMVRKEEILLSNRLEEKLALVLMSLVGGSHYFNRPRWNLDSLIDRLKLPLEVVQEILVRLEKNGLLIISSDEPPAYLPARDIETIPLTEVVGAVRSPQGNGMLIEDRYLSHPGVDEIASEAEDAMKASLGNITVKDLVLKAESAPKP